jgi:iron complex outermembrane receptor protein
MPIEPFARIGDSDSDFQSNMESYGVSGQLDWNLGSAALTAITAYRWWDWDPANDGDGTGLPVVTLAQQSNRLRQFSQEIRLASKGQNTIDYVLGAYYYWQTNRGVLNIEFGDAAPDWFLPALNTTLANAALDGFGYQGTSTQTTRSYALFGQGVWNASDAFKVTAGLRYTHEKKKGAFDQIQVTGADFSGLPDALQAAALGIRDNFGPERSFATRFTDNSLSGLLSVSYFVTPDTMVYATYSRGSKSGGLNLTSLPTGVDPEVRPEKVNSYEIAG